MKPQRIVEHVTVEPFDDGPMEVSRLVTGPGVPDVVERFDDVAPSPNW
jgi:hypothetical protein